MPKKKLILTSEQKIKSIVFATEDGKNVQHALTYYGKTHKIWVHTVNMQEEELAVEVLRNMHSDCMEIKDEVMAALESVKSYPKEKVSADGLLELPFKVDDTYKADAETNPAYYGIQIAKKVKDPDDAKKEVLVIIDDQLMINQMTAPHIVRTADLKSVGIKTEATTLSKEEKIALRKKILFFKHTALIVTESTLTPEAVQNTDVLVTVDEIEEMAEIPNESACVCKEYDLIWGNKVSCDFRKKVVEICKDLWLDKYKAMANGLMAVMNVETGGSFKAHQIMGKSLQDVKTIKKDDFYLNGEKKSSRAVGLIQFTQAALTQIGEFTNGSGFDKLHDVKLKFAQMGEVKQLDYVKKYFEESKNEIKNPEDIYLQVFAPSGVGKNDDYVLYSDGTNNYTQNKSIDTENNNDGKIQRSEILGRYRSSYATGTANKVKNLNCGLKQDINSNSNWHEPVDNPISTLYMQSGGGGVLGEHWGLFGKTRNGKVHQGLDLFVESGSDVYACVEGEVYKSQIHTGYGNTVTIKITDKDAFNNHKRDYELLYSNEGEIIEGEHFDKTEDIYLFYAHLKEVLVKEGDKVKAGDVIAKSGVSGVSGGTCAPHLHFEIFTTLYAVGLGLNYRCNPGFYVHFKGPTEQSQIDKDLQKNTADNGKVTE